jgi:hypothetical protein
MFHLRRRLVRLYAELPGRAWQVPPLTFLTPMRIVLTSLLALLACFSSLDAKVLRFTEAFPDERLRGKSYDLSDSDYARAWAMGTVIMEKNEQLFGRKMDRSGDIDTQIQRWNRIRRESNALMDELNDFLRSRGTRVR